MFLEKGQLSLPISIPRVSQLSGESEAVLLLLKHGCKGLNATTSEHCSTAAEALVQSPVLVLVSFQSSGKFSWEVYNQDRFHPGMLSGAALAN